MNVFLSVVGIVGAIVFLIMAIINLIKKQQKNSKKYSLLAILCIVIFIIGVSITPSKTQSTHKSSTSKTEITKSDKTSKANKIIAKSLKEDQGFANGSLDENGKPTSNGTPNKNFDYAKYPITIKFTNKNLDTLQIDVAEDFLNLDQATRNSYVVRYENIALLSLDGIRKVSQDEYSNGLAVSIISNGKRVGLSKIDSNKELKWYK